MEILREEEDSLDIRVELLEVRCPYCNALLEPKEEKKLCRCGVIEYEIVKEKKKERNTERYEPLYRKKIVELDCFPSEDYIRFKIVKEIPDKVYLYVEEPVKRQSEVFREFLSLPLEQIYSYALKGGKPEKRKKIVVYTGNLDFDAIIKFLRLINERVLSKTFSEYIKEVYDGDSKGQRSSEIQEERK